MSRVGETRHGLRRPRRGVPRHRRGELDRPGAERRGDRAGAASSGPRWASTRPAGSTSTSPGFGEEKEELVRAGYGANYDAARDAEGEVRPRATSSA